MIQLNPNQKYYHEEEWRNEIWHWPEELIVIDNCCQNEGENTSGCHLAQEIKRKKWIDSFFLK